MAWWVALVVALGAGLLLTWIALVVVLLVTRPSQAVVVEATRLLPDVLRLVTRLARDRSLPRGLRLRLWLLLGYLALPFDVIPDVIPVIGYADDAVIVAVVLRSVVRRAGFAPVAGHWPGTPDGLAVVARLAGLPTTTTDGTDDGSGHHPGRCDP